MLSLLAHLSGSIALSTCLLEKCKNRSVRLLWNWNKIDWFFLTQPNPHERSLFIREMNSLKSGQLSISLSDRLQEYVSLKD